MKSTKKIISLLRLFSLNQEMIMVSQIGSTKGFYERLFCHNRNLRKKLLRKFEHPYWENEMKSIKETD